MADLLITLLSNLDPSAVAKLVPLLKANPQAVQILKMIYDKLHAGRPAIFTPALGADHPANRPAINAAAAGLPVRVNGR